MGMIATHSGLRGRPWVELTEELVEHTIARLIELIGRWNLPATIGVARDERQDSESLAKQVIEATVSRGADAIDFGVVSTPGAKLASRSRGLGGAVVVTGSHLAPELNGFKLVAGPNYGPVDVRGLPEPAAPATAQAWGRLWRVETAAQEHVAAICASVDVELIRSAGLRVGFAGGAGSAAVLLLEELGCSSRNGRRDLSLRLDADGDRLQLGDERGVALDAELTLPLALLALDPSLVVKGADTSRIVDALAATRGAKVRTVPPGEIHLVRTLAVSGADLAGEGNGGVIVPAVGLARDGLAAAAVVIGLLARSQRSVSELVAEFPRYSRRRSEIPCDEPALARGRLAAISDRLGVEAEDPRVGVQVESENGAWGLVRLSATEPVVRVCAEAGTDSEAEALHAELRAVVLEGGSLS